MGIKILYFIDKNSFILYFIKLFLLIVIFYPQTR
jgi:hypothetical protein